MKWNSLRRALLDDFTGYAGWFENFFDLFNGVIENANRALNNGLRFEENHVCSKVTVKLTNGVEKTVESQTLRGVVSMVLVGDSPALERPIKWTAAGAGKVKVTCEFVGSPTTEQTVTLYLFE